MRDFFQEICQDFYDMYVKEVRDHMRTEHDKRQVSYIKYSIDPNTSELLIYVPMYFNIDTLQTDSQKYGKLIKNSYDGEKNFIFQTLKKTGTKFADKYFEKMIPNDKKRELLSRVAQSMRDDFLLEDNNE